MTQLGRRAATKEDVAEAVKSRADHKKEMRMKAGNIGKLNHILSQVKSKFVHDGALISLGIKMT